MGKKKPPQVRRLIPPDRLNEHYLFGSIPRTIQNQISNFIRSGKEPTPGTYQYWTQISQNFFNKEVYNILLEEISTPITRPSTPPLGTRFDALTAPETPERPSLSTEMEVDIPPPPVFHLGDKRPPPTPSVRSDTTSNLEVAIYPGISVRTIPQPVRAVPTPLPPPTSSNPSSTSSLPSTVSEAIFIARDFIRKAVDLSNTRTEESRLLDLLEVFRDYTEENRLTVRSIRPNPSTTTSIPTTRSLKPTSKTPRTYAVATASNLPPKPLLKPINPISRPPLKAPVAIKGPSTSRQLVLREPTLPASFSTRELRDSFNSRFSSKEKTPVLAACTISPKGNLVLTTTSTFSSNYLLENKPLWESILPFKVAEKPYTWSKVAVHGLPTKEFASLEALSLLEEEIATFNKGIKLVGTPYWLTHAEKRVNQPKGSVCLAFSTESEANRAIKNSLYIAGLRLKVERLRKTS